MGKNYQKSKKQEGITKMIPPTLINVSNSGWVNKRCFPLEIKIWGKMSSPVSFHVKLEFEALGCCCCGGRKRKKS